MIILDTNVISEAMRLRPHPGVLAWLNGQTSETLYLSSVTLAELLFGIAVLPAGKRKDTMKLTVDNILALFKNRVLPFDADAASRYGELAAKARANGRGFPTHDGYIAAIAASNNFMVATRDTAPYDAVGVAVINPWDVSIGSDLPKN